MSYTKRNVRSGYRSPKRYNNYSRTNNNYSHNKFRSKVNFSQMHEKYLNLAKEASSIGDKIQAEYYNQFADHYSRIMVEQDNVNTDKENLANKNSEENVDTQIQQDDEKKISIDLKKNEKKEKEEEVDENNNSIDQIPFISEPPKKTVKPKK